MSMTKQIDFPFSTVLEIRAQFALAKIYQRCNLCDHYAVLNWCLREVGKEAYRAAEANDADVPCPLLFSDEPMLVNAWDRGIQFAADERYRWYAKSGLPDAQTLYGLLVRGQLCEVRGHSLSPDEDGVWITNPYGNDCGLWQNVTLERVEDFLKDMVEDKQYGPIP